MRVAARAALALAALALGACASIHSYDAAREINPVKTLSVSGSVGTTFDDRDRNGDKVHDGWRTERVLVPDARLNIAIKLNEVASITLDPLPPAIGGGLLLHYRAEDDWAPTITLAPGASRLVFPNQNVWSVDVPLAFSWRAGRYWVLYGGPKYIYQTHTLTPLHGPDRYLFSQVPVRPDQPLEFQGVFAGFAVGGLHLQISPEVVWLESRRKDNERIFQVGSQIRLSL